MNRIILVEVMTFFLFYFIQRSACHFQVFALSRWLAVKLPVNYYEFARGLGWSIPYFSLPWESGHIQPVVVGSSPPTNSDSSRSKIHDSGIFLGVQPKQGNLSRAASIYKARLRPSPKEYISFFQVWNLYFFLWLAFDFFNHE